MLQRAPAFGAVCLSGVFTWAPTFGAIFELLELPLAKLRPLEAHSGYQIYLSKMILRILARSFPRCHVCFIWPLIKNLSKYPRNIQLLRRRYFIDWNRDFEPQRGPKLVTHWALRKKNRKNPGKQWTYPRLLNRKIMVFLFFSPEFVSKTGHVKTPWRPSPCWELGTQKVSPVGHCSKWGPGNQGLSPSI